MGENYRLSLAKQMSSFVLFLCNNSREQNSLMDVKIADHSEILQDIFFQLIKKLMIQVFVEKNILVKEILNKLSTISLLAIFRIHENMVNI